MSVLTTSISNFESSTLSLVNSNDRLPGIESFNWINVFPVKDELVKKYTDLKREKTDLVGLHGTSALYVFDKKKLRLVAFIREYGMINYL